MRLGALEAGGTKMVLGLLDGRMRLIEQTSLATKNPEETIPAIIEQFASWKIEALGIASFGPINLRSGSANYGSILNTPKLAWQRYPLYSELYKTLQVPCRVDTDVNAAALAEARMGAAKGLKNCLYLTVGTGIGGGLYSEGNLVHGLMHPEWGHMLLPRHEEDPMLFGVCPYHPNCAEGFASGPAMQARWGIPGKDLPLDHRGWEIEAFYLAQVCVNAMMTVSPEMILLGGGVMSQETLLPLVRSQVLRLINGYIDQEQLPPMSQLIQSPSLYPDSGMYGAGLLAYEAYKAKAK